MYSPQQLTKVKNSNLDKVLSTAKSILHEYSLCEYCTGRLFAKKLGLLQHHTLGKKIQNLSKTKPAKKCYICKGIMLNLQKYLDMMRDASSEYEFDTFLVGAILKPSMIDNDDVIRSKFKLKGIDSLKTEFTHQLAKKFSRMFKKNLDHLSPELTFTLNLKNDSCSVASKPLCIQGRYVKKIRGVPQKQISCRSCKGKGCNFCNYHGISGFDSVEGTIASFLITKFEGTKTKIHWIGGEDKSSLVIGKGRPFFARLLNPKKRTAKKLKNFHKNGIIINQIKIIDQIPKENLRFRSVVRISVETDEKLSSSKLRLLNRLKKSYVSIEEKPNKKNEKLISDLKYKKSSQNSFNLFLSVEGGMPIKRFVEGNSINPNLSVLLNTKCTCKKFDFQKVSIVKS